MTLRRRARLLALVSVLVALALLGLFLLTYQARIHTERALILTESLAFETTQLRTSLFDYLLHPQSQPRAPVEAQFETLRGLLTREAGAIADAARVDAQARYAWESVRRLADALQALFAEVGGAASDPRLTERDRRTTDLLLVDSHALILLVRQLRHQANVALLAATSRQNLTLSLLLAGMSAVGLALFLTLQRTVLDPVHQLHEAAVRVTRGEVDRRLRSHRRDELGELANAFDRMLDQLQETTVSRDRLEAEIEERTRAEAEIQRLNVVLEERVSLRTAELQAANRELESFAYAVSHDLRAPLRALNGFSQALLEDYGERLDGEARIDLEQIGIASRRMGALIDGILTLSRSTRGGLRSEPVDLTALAQRLLVERAAAEPHRQVAWEVEPGLCVQGDPTMLEVVLVNLIDNAWKYTGKTEAATIRVSAAERAGRRWVCVSDNGAGFDMAYAERLFNAFQRLHRQDEFPGLGIGLATVQRIIHRHGGAIDAEGAPGRGAVVCFTLPAAASRQEPI